MKALRVGNDCKQYHGARCMVHVATQIKIIIGCTVTILCFTILTTVSLRHHIHALRAGNVYVQCMPETAIGETLFEFKSVVYVDLRLQPPAISD